MTGSGMGAGDPTTGVSSADVRTRPGHASRFSPALGDGDPVPPRACARVDRPSPSSRATCPHDCGDFLATTNAAESLLSRTRHVKRNVKRWRGGQMMLRWVAAGVLEAVKGFRRLKGYADMPTLVAALRARDRQLGLVVAQEERQIA